jgi:nitrate/TMAO reductase-like tetraheme cytochrome c subunit
VTHQLAIAQGLYQRLAKSSSCRDSWQTVTHQLAIAHQGLYQRLSKSSSCRDYWKTVTHQLAIAHQGLYQLGTSDVFVAK